MKRRNFLKNLSLLGVSATSLTMLQLNTAFGNSSAAAPIHFVYDKHYCNPRNMSAAFLSSIEASFPIEGNVTEVWFDELYYHWQKRSRTTVGLTGQSDFFILKSLARDQGYRVLYEERTGDLISWALVPHTLRGSISAA